jgi:hypothetical protein
MTELALLYKQHSNILNAKLFSTRLAAFTGQPQIVQIKIDELKTLLHRCEVNLTGSITEHHSSLKFVRSKLEKISSKVDLEWQWYRISPDIAKLIETVCVDSKIDRPSFVPKTFSQLEDGKKNGRRLFYFGSIDVSSLTPESCVSIEIVLRKMILEKKIGVSSAEAKKKRKPNVNNEPVSSLIIRDDELLTDRNTADEEFVFGVRFEECVANNFTLLIGESKREQVKFELTLANVGSLLNTERCFYTKKIMQCDIGDKMIVRINSSLPFRLNNMAVCCMEIAELKSFLSPSDFKGSIAIITKHREHQQTTLEPVLSGESHNVYPSVGFYASPLFAKACV